MRRILGFLILSFVKVFSWCFYRAQFYWLTDIPDDHWNKTRLMVFLGHTSLYEPLFIQAFPFSYIWNFAKYVNVPGADVTLNRPIVGTFWKLMVPNIAAISRKKDATWENYLSTIGPESVVVIAPEGRMKRPNGLDKFGNPMSIRGGVADIINSMEKGGMILCFSGGLHHVQAPGQFLPRIFKTINMNLAYFDIEDYKKNFPPDARERKIKIIQDLEIRLKRDCPHPSLNK